MLNQLDRKITQILLADHHRAFRHICIHIIVLFISINVFWDEPDAFIVQRFTSWLLYFLFIDAAIYINMYILVPRLLFRDRTLTYLLATSGFILCMVLGIGFMQSGADEKGAGIDTPPVIGITSGFLSFALFIIGLTALQLLRFRIGNTSKINALNATTMRIELAMLKNQINPHFLFNMLNNAHFMVEENPKKSAKILSRLKDLLFYQMEYGSYDKVSLKQEITFIRDYLALEKLRRDRFNYSMHLENIVNIEIPPLLFIPFIENAVKHNPENDAHIDITIKLSYNTLYFSCCNPKAKNKHRQVAGGIGLANTSRRLELLYEKDHQLEYKDMERLYMVQMTLNL